MIHVADDDDVDSFGRPRRLAQRRPRVSNGRPGCRHHGTATSPSCPDKLTLGRVRNLSHRPFVGSRLLGPDAGARHQPSDRRVGLGGVLEPEIVQVGRPRERRSHAILRVLRHAVTQGLQKRADDAFATANQRCRVWGSPPAHWIETSAVDVPPEGRVGNVHRMNGVLQDSVVAEVVVDEEPDPPERLGWRVDEVLEPYLEIVLWKQSARGLSSADHPLPIESGNGNAAIPRTRRQPALSIQRQGAVASIPDDMDDERVGNCPLDLAEVEHVRGCGLDPSLHALDASDSIHQARQKIGGRSAPGHRLANDRLDVETGHVPEIAGQELLDEARARTVCYELWKPVRDDKEVCLLAIEGEPSCRDEHRIQQRRARSGTAHDEDGSFHHVILPRVSRTGPANQTETLCRRSRASRRPERRR